VNDLESLVSSRYNDLTEAEVNLSRAANKGEMAVCGSNLPIDDRTNNPNSWGTSRRIRADLVRWLCVDRHARELVDPRGIRVLAAKISGVLDLSNVIVPFPLTLAYCSLDGELNLRGADIGEINLEGTWVRTIAADRVTVRSSVLLRGGFHSRFVRLPAARIAGNVECDGSTFENHPRPGDPESGLAIVADGAIVNGSIFLREGFRALGEVRLIGAQIGGYFDCTNATFKNAPFVALNAESMVVRAGVFLRGTDFCSQGEVKLAGSRIDGDLDCAAATFSNPQHPDVPSAGVALSLERITARGSVFLHNGFSADGEVRLLGAQISRNLECDGGRFRGASSTGRDGASHSLSAHTVTVEGNVYLRQGFHATGEVAFSGAQIVGNLECTCGVFHGDLNLQAASIKGVFFWRNVVDAERTLLDLMSTSIGVLADDSKSWPESGKLLLDGLAYERISPRDANSRLEWLNRQDPFAPQPYRHLAKVLRNEGDEAGTRQVLIEMERRRRKKEDRTIYARAGSWILLRTIKYGYAPLIAVGWLVGLILVGVILFSVGYYAGDMVPTEKDAYSQFEDSRRLPPQYERFHATIYSAENSFPLVKLGQVDRWQPDPNPHKSAGHTWDAAPCFPYLFGWALLWFRWIQVLLGWFFATMFVAGVTGIVRRE
jgi:hypothetical protein